jgi:FkbM family methyltransferase
MPRMATDISLDAEDPDLADLDPEVVRRIRQTVACRDADPLPRVEGAGEVFELDGVSVQRMFNGTLVEEGCYYGDFITPIIRRLNGVHEPQEEVVVHAIVERLRAEQERGELAAPVAVELGAHWSYYSIWFCRALTDAVAVAMEPDPTYLEIGRRNAVLNGVSDSVAFVPGAIGADPGTTFGFRAESDGVVRDTEAHDLRSLLRLGGVERADILFCDIQGFETTLLELSGEDLRAGAVRFVVMSTHHSSISGSPLTHQRAVERLRELGGHVVAEHSVSESSSGDGLVVVSFDPRDADLTVAVSHARSRDSLFGELEFEVEHHRVRAERLQAEVDALAAENARLTHRLGVVRRKLRRSRAELEAAHRSSTWRAGRLLVAPAARATALVRGVSRRR